MLEFKLIHDLLSFLTLLGQLLLILSVLAMLFFYKKTKKIFSYFKINALLFAWIVALVATLGSLYYSEIAGFNPCNLCWWQRIFIYPQVFLLGLAYFRKDRSIIDYSLSLIGLGTLFSLYHNYIYYTTKTSSLCSLSIPCVQKYIVGLNYITIPLMALSSLLLMAFFLLILKYSKNNS
jgi:disulfide bond formation protein DsbB